MCCTVNKSDHLIMFQYTHFFEVAKNAHLIRKVNSFQLICFKCKSILKSLRPNQSQVESFTSVSQASPKSSNLRLDTSHVTRVARLCRTQMRQYLLVCLLWQTVFFQCIRESATFRAFIHIWHACAGVNWLGEAVGGANSLVEHNLP